MNRSHHAIHAGKGKPWVLQNGPVNAMPEWYMQEEIGGDVFSR
jgi:hypothetical protein